jgi:hypothetical protein
MKWYVRKKNDDDFRPRERALVVREVMVALPVGRPPLGVAEGEGLIKVYLLKYEDGASHQIRVSDVDDDELTETEGTGNHFRF